MFNEVGSCWFFHLFFTPEFFLYSSCRETRRIFEEKGRKSPHRSFLPNFVYYYFVVVLFGIVIYGRKLHELVYPGDINFRISLSSCVPGEPTVLSFARRLVHQANARFAFLASLNRRERCPLLFLPAIVAVVDFAVDQSSLKNLFDFNDGIGQRKGAC